MKNLALFLLVLTSVAHGQSEIQEKAMERKAKEEATKKEREKLAIEAKLREQQRPKELSRKLPFNALSSEDMHAYATKCGAPPTFEQMKADVNAWLKSARKDPQKDNVTLDGMRMNKIANWERMAIEDLTWHRQAKNWVYDSIFQSKLKKVDSGFEQQRWYRRSDGKNRNSDLSMFNQTPPCSDAVCVVQKIFGPEKGIKILWAKIKYGSNLSSLSDFSADPNGFNDEEFNALFVSFAAVPKDLQWRTLNDSGFFRVWRGASGGGPIANARGAITDEIDKLDANQKIYALFHEHCHLMAGNLDESPKWTKATGWKIMGLLNHKNDRSDGWISEYSKRNAAEDFAESCATYRFKPEKLKQVSPERYQFMKDHLFRNLEFDKDLCNGLVNGRSSETDAGKSGGNRTAQ